MLPTRVPMIIPSSGVKPMEVSTHLPFWMAQMELPAPRWQVMILALFTSRPASLAKHYLKLQGFESDRDRNQIANFTYIDYNTNIDIADNPPADYVARYCEKLGEDGYKLTCEQNALPIGFENMGYLEFLQQRRLLMSSIIKKAYLKLCE